MLRACSSLRLSTRFSSLKFRSRPEHRASRWQRAAVDSACFSRTRKSWVDIPDVTADADVALSASCMRLMRGARTLWECQTTSAYLEARVLPGQLAPSHPAVLAFLRRVMAAASTIPSAKHQGCVDRVVSEVGAAVAGVSSSPSLSTSREHDVLDRSAEGSPDPSSVISPEVENMAADDSERSRPPQARSPRPLDLCNCDSAKVLRSLRRLRWV